MSDKPYRHFKDKELYGPNTIDDHYQPRDREPAQCIEETSANPCRSGWTTHLAEPQVGTIAGVAEWLRAEQTK